MEFPLSLCLWSLVQPAYTHSQTMHVSFYILPVAMNESAVIFNSYSPSVRRFGSMFVQSLLLSLINSLFGIWGYNGEAVRTISKRKPE